MSVDWIADIDGPIIVERRCLDARAVRSNDISSDLPDGQITRLLFLAFVHPLVEKYFAFAVGQITFRSSRHPRPIRGAFRDRHGRWARDAMDAFARQDEPREADGEVVWS
jgi:hypothetical protein